MTKSLFKNPFLAHFPENPDLSSKSSYRFLELCQNSEKTNDTIPRKCLDRRTDERSEGRTDPFYRTLPATAGGPKICYNLV